MKKNVKKFVKLMKLIEIIKGIGKIRVISTSKIKKITAIKKNRRENGIRAFDLGSNPHSNADGFSRSWIFFFEINELIIIKAVEIVIANVEISKITSIKFLNFLIGSQIYFLYYWCILAPSSIYSYIKKNSYHIYKMSVSRSCFKTKVVNFREMIYFHSNQAHQ